MTQFHLIGIGGAGMSVVAELLAQSGFEVRGSDARASAVTEALEQQGIKVYIGQAAENVDPQAMASISAWVKDPAPMWAWYLWRARLAHNAQPNAGHEALARWASISDVHVTTQNIDNLHERAGSPEVTHLHGSLFEWRCTICARNAEIATREVTTIAKAISAEVTSTSCVRSDSVNGIRSRGLRPMCFCVEAFC